MSLADARDRQAKARKLLKEGIDPNAARRNKLLKGEAVVQNSFQVVALEWLEVRKSAWSEYYSRQVLQRLQLDTGGIIEGLNTGQQFIAHGTHTSGVRYQWRHDGEFPTISRELYDGLYRHLRDRVSSIEGLTKASH